MNYLMRFIRINIKEIRGSLLLLTGLAIFLVMIIDYSFAVIYQPDPGYYSINREELLTVSETAMKKIPVPWIVACAKDGSRICWDSSLSRIQFDASFLQRFEVLTKERSTLRVRELNKSSPRSGWVNMKELVYLPRSLKDERTGSYQRVFFTHRVEDLEPSEIGRIKFYQEPRESASYIEKIMDASNFLYVYAWEKSKYEDSKFVLIGNYPSIDGVVTNKSAFRKIIYGWCKASNLFPWNSRIALIPNERIEYPAYIFSNGPELVHFYNKIDLNPVPSSKSLLTVNPKKMWSESKWPFLLHGILENGNHRYLRLVCLVESQKYRKQRAYIMKLGYSKEFDPRSPHIPLFKNVYLFRKCEVVRVIGVLNRTLNLLNRRMIINLLKELIESMYGEEYEPGRTFNDYARMHDGIVYKNMSVLFGKTQKQINRLLPQEFEEISRKLAVVKDKLENLLNDTTRGRFFGPRDDPYIWLYDYELP
jgi:hypothetical protein